jgi:hypothetical protein
LKCAKQVPDSYTVPHTREFSGGSKGEIGKYLQKASQLAVEEKTKYLAAQSIPGSIASDDAKIGKRDMINTVLVTQELARR